MLLLQNRAGLKKMREGNRARRARKNKDGEGAGERKVCQDGPEAGIGADEGQIGLSEGCPRALELVILWAHFPCQLHQGAPQAQIVDSEDHVCTHELPELQSTN